MNILSDGFVKGKELKDLEAMENELMNSWRFALREGLFVETKEGICRNKDKKS